MIGEIVIALIFIIPIFAFFIWTYHFPEDSFLFGKRRRHQEEPEVSSKVVFYMKFTSIVAMIATPILIFSFFLKQSGLALIVLIVIFLVGVGIIFTRD